MNVEFADFKDVVGQVDPSQVEKVDSWYGISFEAVDDSSGITFTVIDFDSEAYARDHYGTITSQASGLQEMPSTIGDASTQAEVNAGGIGSMLIFLSGDKIASIHTTQLEGQLPLVSPKDLEELAGLVVNRL